MRRRSFYKLVGYWIVYKNRVCWILVEITLRFFTRFYLLLDNS